MKERDPIACNLGALSPQEREQRAHLARALEKAIRGIEELPSGYKVRIDPNSEAAVGLERLVELEQRCCPFLKFKIDDGVSSQHRVLEITGTGRVKEFLEVQFGLGRGSERAG